MQESEGAEEIGWAETIGVGNIERGWLGIQDQEIYSLLR